MFTTCRQRCVHAATLVNRLTPRVSAAMVVVLLSRRMRRVSRTECAPSPGCTSRGLEDEFVAAAPGASTPLWKRTDDLRQRPGERARQRLGLELQAKQSVSTRVLALDIDDNPGTFDLKPDLGEVGERGTWVRIVNPASGPRTEHGGSRAGRRRRTLQCPRHRERRREELALPNVESHGDEARIFRVAWIAPVTLMRTDPTVPAERQSAELLDEADERLLLTRVRDRGEAMKGLIADCPLGSSIGDLRCRCHPRSKGTHDEATLPRCLAPRTPPGILRAAVARAEGVAPRTLPCVDHIRGPFGDNPSKGEFCESRGLRVSMVLLAHTDTI